MNFPLPDVPTIYLMTGVASIVGAAISMLLRNRDDFSRQSLPLIAISVLSMGTGFSLLGLRGALPVDFATGLANVFLAVSAMYLLLGTEQLIGQPRKAGTVAAITAGYCVAMLLIVGADPRLVLWRNLLSTLFYVSFFSLSGLVLLRSPLFQSLRAVKLLFALFVLFAAILVIRLSLYFTTGVALQADGIPAVSWSRTLFALAFGTIPFALVIAAHGVVHGRLSAHLAELAATDMLTGLVSRRTLHERGPGMLADSEAPIALLMIDLDDFKQINDDHGHAVGDRVLQHLAAVLRASLRADSIVVRYGGDEFCVLTSVQNEAAAFSIAERIRASVEATPYRHGDALLPVTMSVGVSLHRSGRTLWDLLEEADHYAYEAKSLGRNRVMAAAGVRPSVPPDLDHGTVSTADHT